MELAFWMLAGLLMLALGGELLVRGAVQLAARLGVSPLLVGLTVVAFGTSMPELVTSVQAALAGSPGIAVGNIVGSNIANVLLILGIAALLCPVAVDSRALGRDGVIGAGLAGALLLVGLFGALDRPMGMVLLAGLTGYILLAWWQERAATTDHGAAFDKAEAFREAHPPGLALDRPLGGLAGALGLTLGGLVVIVLGGRILVDAAVELARVARVSEEVIGLTIIAVGTSLPELVTSAVAAWRRQSDVALGNVLGSNIYNILGIAGATALIAPTPVPEAIVRFDMWVMLGASLLLLWVARTGWRVGRREGGVLVAAYGLYIWWSWPG